METADETVSSELPTNISTNSTLTTLRDFQTLGCDDQTKIAIACRVYLNLKEDKSIKDLEKFYDAELSLIYLRACRNGCINIFLPILSTQDINLLEVEKIQSKFADENIKNFSLAICDAASNVLYYQINSGFIEKTS